MEPYEFRLPLSEQIALGLAGLYVQRGDLRIALFLVLGFHGLLRPGELMALRWRHLVFWWDSLSALRVVLIDNPRIKSLALQHVLLESSAVRDFCVVACSERTKMDSFLVSTPCSFS